MSKRLKVVAWTVLLVGLLYGQTSPPLAAGFSHRPSVPWVGDIVKFKDWSSGNPVSWSWDFGDGTTSTEKNPTHVFTTVGSFQVTLTVSDGVTTSTAIRAFRPEE